MPAGALAQDGPITEDAAVTQDANHQPPAHISLVEGSAVLERDGRTETALSSMPVLAGDRLRTQAGRVEVLFADGSTLHLDANTLVDFQSDDVIRLLGGRVRVSIAGPERRVGYRIDAPSAWVQINRPGEYRISVQGARGGEVELAVLRGAAELVNEDGSTSLGAGERAYANPGAAPSYAYVYNSAAWDAFDQWSEARRDQRLGASAQYLPSDVRSYAGTLDHYGSWNYQPTYGYVWYPRVHTGWRPYYHGRWTHLRPYGWTWIGLDPWAWATHHYGRWGFSAGAWFWIPGRTWGPAWVSWAYAPGYVSWCPLGWNNRPVFSFINVNVFHGRRFDPWHGWTVLPHRSFNTRIVNVGINVVNVNRIDVRTRQAFTPRDRDRGPEYRGYAVPRSPAPIRVAGTGNISAGRLDRDAPGGVTPRTRAGDRTGDASFRSRAPSGSQLTGPGFPAPSRERRSALPATPTDPRQSPTAVERNAPSATAGGTGVQRRAVPRQPDSVASPTSDRTAPQRRAVPQYNPAPAAPERSREAAPATQPAPNPYRVAPRRGQYSDPSASPNRETSPTPQPEVWRGTPRAVPRSAEPSAPPAYRPSPGMERRGPSEYRPSPGMERRGPSESRPSGPPPSAGPPRSYGAPASAAPASPRGGPSAGPPARSEPRGGGEAPAARSQGGQPSRGTAVRRGGG